MKKTFNGFLILIILFSAIIPSAMAADNSLTSAGKSLLIPGWGQYHNGEFQTEGGKAKVAVMAAIEVAAIVTTAVVGGTVGMPAAWVGIGLFIGNHVWSALDAFVNAKSEPGVNLSTQQPLEKTNTLR